MEVPVVVTAATGALEPVVARLSTLLRRDGEYKLRRGTRKDIKRIRSKLKSIHSILWVIWEREDLDAEGKKLRMEAWRLADDMNDAIDDFILSLKCSNDGRRFIQAKHLPSPFKDLKTTADDVSERCRKKWKMKTPTTFSSLFSTTKATVDDSGPGKRHRVVDPYVHKDISELVDMEEPRDELIKHLVGEEESTPQLKMACILGAAGMGKTTFARLVYEAIEEKFDARAFVSVTSCRTMTEVLASICQQVQGLADSSTVVPLAGTKAATAEKHLIDDISNFLNDKRYLVIIDDIWHCGAWETIKKSLPDNNRGSRIVTTSRVNSITHKWRDDFDAFVHRINYYQFDWSGSTTNKIIDMNADMVGEGFDHSHRIVHMCRGMPLAMACMISIVAKERERQQQQGLCVLRIRDVQDRLEQQVMRDGIQNTPGFEPLVESLKLDYIHLPHHMLKTCLLYCSIYPERHKFRRDALVRRWIAEGSVCKEEAAKDYFDELVSRGLFQEFQWLEGYSFYKFHPMMRNYLRRKLREDNFITCTSDSIPSAPVGRLCIDDWTNSDAVDCLSGIDWRHIRALVVFNDAERVPYKDLEHLRVLNVEYGYEDVENQHLKDMCGLLHLRHLLLREGWITEIPADIGRLMYLESLEVSETNLTRLPAEIGDLKQLKTLNLSGNKGITELPKEIGKLQHLEMLNLKRTSLTELPHEFWNLQRLVYLNLSDTAIKTVPRDIGKLQHLEYLDLCDTKVKKMPREIRRLPNLKYLKSELGILPFEAGQLSQLKEMPECVRQAWKNSHLVSSLAGETLSFSSPHVNGVALMNYTKHMGIPQWIEEHFNNVNYLDIRICKLEECDLKILREMPNLVDLRLRFEGVSRKPIAISGGRFEKLEHLTVDSRVPRITFQEGAMPRLFRLVFEFQFYGGPPNTDPMGIKHLVNLGQVYFECNKWYRGGSPCISAAIDVVTKEASGHPNKLIEVRLRVGDQEGVVFPRPDGAETSHQGSNEACSSGAEEIEETQA